MWFGLLAAPLAWLVDELIAYYIASRLCSSAPAENPAAYSLATSAQFVALTLTTFGIAVAGLLVAVANWRKTRHEQPGSGHHLLELGEGRTRFLAMCALLGSGGFCIAFAFTLVYMVVAPVCAS